MRTASILRTPPLRCGHPSDPVVAMTIGEWCALDDASATAAAAATASCGCIIPGSEPGESGSCLAFHHGAGTTAGGSCDAGAQRFAGLVSASTALCWTMATICLAASVVRLLTICYQHRRCPPCLACLWRPREQTVPPYLQHNGGAAAAAMMSTTTTTTSMAGNLKEKERKGPLPSTSCTKAKPPPAYYLRDAGAV